MRSRPRPAFPTGCCTARRSRSAWRWRSSSPRGAACCRKAEAERVDRAILRRSACRPMSRPCPAATGPTLDALMDLIAQDKKVKRGKLTFILVRGIGAGLRRPRRRCRRGPRLPGREARRAMSDIDDWLAVCSLVAALPAARRSSSSASETRADGGLRARDAAAGEEPAIAARRHRQPPARAARERMIGALPARQQCSSISRRRR